MTTPRFSGVIPPVPTRFTGDGLVVGNPFYHPLTGT